MGPFFVQAQGAALAPTIPTSEPSEFVAGDSVFFDIADATYPPSEGWALSYAFVGASPFELGPDEITADPVAGLYRVRVPPSVTGTLSPGTYTWYRYASIGSPAERHTAMSGVCYVQADKVGAAGTPTAAEQELPLVDAAIRALLAGGVKAYQIQGRAFTKLDLPELLKWRGKLRNEVSLERAAAAGRESRFGRKIGVAFRGPR